MKKWYWFLMITSVMSYSQNFEWVNNPTITFAGNSNNIAYTVATDNANTIYLSGFKDTPYTNGLTFGNVFYRKYNLSGTVLFSKFFNGKVNIVNIISDSNNNMIVSATYFDSITIDSTVITSSGENQIILKFDSNGNLLWHKNLNDLLTGSYPCKALATDSSNSIYLGYDNFSNSYISKLNSVGTLEMTINQLNVSILTSIAVDNSGNIYSTGGCASSNASFAGVLQNPNLSYNEYATKYSSNGVHQWTKYINSGFSCGDIQIVAKSENEVYFGGKLNGAYSFGTIATSGPGNSSSDFFISKINSLGNFEWVREIPGTVTAVNVFHGNKNYLALDVFGNVYFAGKTRGVINWTPSIITSTPSNYDDCIFLKYNSSGFLQAAKTVHGDYNSRFDGISCSPDGDIYISGLINGNANFDAIPVTTSGSTYYPILAKISASPLSISKNEVTEIYISPNPVKDFIYFSESLERIKGSIYTILGQKIKSFETGSKIDVQDFKSGIYVVQLDNNTIFKFIKD